MLGIYILLVLGSGIALVFDDPIARMLGRRTEVVHLALAALAAAAVIGGGWVWLNR